MQGSHAEILTTVLSLSPQGCSPGAYTIFEGQVQSLAEVSDLRQRLSSRRADQAGVSPDVQNRALLLVSA